MTRMLLFLFTFCFISDSTASTSNDMKWSHRSVIYFAPSHDEYVERFLLETLMNECDLSQRDIVILVITQDGYTKPNWVKYEFDLSALFRLYQIQSNQHTAILLGKDGQEKMRWGKQTDWPVLKQTVDNIPIRQQEMISGDDPCSI